MRVVRNSDDDKDGFIFDDFDTGLVDLGDFQNLLKHDIPKYAEDEPHFVSVRKEGALLPSQFLQASLIGHVIRERYAFDGYEKYVDDVAAGRRSVITDEELIDKYHSKGIKRECEILIEMTKARDNTFDESFSTRVEREYIDAGLRARYFPNIKEWKLASFYFCTAKYKIDAGFLYKLVTTP